MGTFHITMPDGSEFTAEGNSVEEAHANVQSFLKSEEKPASQKAYEDAPITTKARMAISDPLNQFVHGMTAGWFDKGFDALTGAKSAQETQAGAERMGAVPTTLARAGGAMMLPSGAPGAVAAVGGGPITRGLVGAGVAGAEGAAYGGANAAAEGSSVPAGLLAGGVGGAVGQGVVQGATAGVNKALYPPPAIPPRNMTTFGNIKTPSAKDRVDVAASRATSSGKVAGTAEATQAAQKEQFERLLTGSNKGQFTPTQREYMAKIAYGDPGTRAATKVGGLLDNPYVAAGVGGVAGFGSGGILPGLLAAATTAGTGKALAKDSAKATQEAVDNLRRLMNKQKVVKSPLSLARRRTLGQGAGYEGFARIEDYLDE